MKEYLLFALMGVSSLFIHAQMNGESNSIILPTIHHPQLSQPSQPSQLSQPSNHKLYLIAGHGSDIRAYAHVKFPENVDTIHLHWITPLKEESMHEYAVRFSQKIDTTQPFSIMGLSLGGMVACEMTSFLNPERVFIVSSAAGRSELPVRYRMMRNFEMYRIFSGEFYKLMAKTAQLVFEPDRRRAGEEFDAMIRDKDPDFYKRGIHMIANWEGEYESDGDIIHIHGTKDHTVPIRNVCADAILEKGSHMMLLTEAGFISEQLRLFFQ